MIKKGWGLYPTYWFNSAGSGPVGMGLLCPRASRRGRLRGALLCLLAALAVNGAPAQAGDSGTGASAAGDPLGGSQGSGRAGPGSYTSRPQPTRPVTTTPRPASLAGSDETPIVPPDSVPRLMSFGGQEQAAEATPPASGVTLLTFGAAEPAPSPAPAPSESPAAAFQDPTGGAPALPVSEPSGGAPR